MTDRSGGASRPGRTPLLLGVFGLVLIVTAAVGYWRSRPAPSVGAPAVVALASPTASASVAPSPAAPAASAAPADEIAPTGLRIAALDLTATVVPAGVDAKTGDFAVPPSVDRVGWYRFGPGLTATAGSIVMSGHVDAADQGKGAFFRLGDLEPGDPIVLTGPDGATREFEVVARERYRKTKIPLDKYFARDGAPRLTLITCGGPFDRATGHYRDNVVVTANRSIT